MIAEEVRFHAARGGRLSGVVSLPGEARTRSPAVVLCQGLSGVHHLVLPEVARWLADAGVASLRFDYTGYGESDGERGWIDPRARVDDAMSALAWLAQHPSVDPGRLGAYGHSYGGPVAVTLAARDRRVRAVVSVSGPVSGSALLGDLRGPEETAELLRRVEQERTEASVSGRRQLVGLEEILPFSPAFKARYDELKAGGGTSARQSGDAVGTSQFWLATVDAMLDFHPEESARRLGPCAVLIVHGEDDDLVPASAVEPLYRALPGPKRLVLVPRAGHNDLDVGPGLEHAGKLAAGWFTDHLS